MDRKALSAAFPVTVPVLMGYLAIGIAFGLMLQEIGYNFIWAFFMSLTIYAGSGQYLGVTLLGAAASLGTVAVMTLLINFRHLVYGLSMLEKFRGRWGWTPGISILPSPCWTRATGFWARSSARWPGR